MIKKILLTLLVLLIILIGWVWYKNSGYQYVNYYVYHVGPPSGYRDIVPVVSQVTTKAIVDDVLPSNSSFLQGEGANIPLSWNVKNIPVGSTIYLDLLLSDGSESLGRITNNSDCSKGGDTVAMLISKNSYKWNGLLVCSNWQAHSVKPGSYRIGVKVYSQDGSSILSSGQSNTPFTLMDKKPKL